MKNMIKRFLVLSMCIFSVFLTTVFAARKTTIKKVEIIDLDTPTLNGVADISAGLKRTEFAEISSIKWYKNGAPMLSSVFDEYATYTCRVFFEIAEGYEINNETEFIHVNASSIKLGEQAKSKFIDINFVLKESKNVYPKRVVVRINSQPTYNKKLSYQAISSNENFYIIDSVEWYKDGVLLNPEEKVSESGKYTCRVYLTLRNGFQITENNEGVFGTEAVSIVVTHDSIYLERDYEVWAGEDPNKVNAIRVSYKSAPAYGQSKDTVKFQIDNSLVFVKRIDWYKNGKVDIDDKFDAGEYVARVFIGFTDSYPATPLQIYKGNSNFPSNAEEVNGELFFQQKFSVPEPYIASFDIVDLDEPELGRIQDVICESAVPSMYTINKIYWYKQNKFMSNVDTFIEDTYTCKITLDTNPNCKISSKLTATINGQKAVVGTEFDKYIITKEYKVTKPVAKWIGSSEWAQPELLDALNNAMIPNCIATQDLRNSITRAEFAAVAVRLYERLSYKLATPVDINPFNDTDDIEVLKAYNLGITNGTSSTTFEPDSLITREEMATMMVRTLTKVGKKTAVDLTKVKKFADHDKIDDWALNGVYYMSNLGIIKGVGNNTFDVFGDATREEALAISIRSVNKFN